jgi:hypothetical protein
MPTYSVGATTPAAATGAAYATFRTSANRRAFLREMGLFTTAATASSVGLGIPANTPTASVSIQPKPHDPADAGADSRIDTAWSVAPTTPATFDRKCTLGAAVGAGVIWKLALDERIVMAVSTWKVFWNHGAGTASVLDVYVEYDE